MNRIVPLAAVLCLTGGVVACSDRDDDVVQAPAPGATPVALPDRQADAAASNAALAFNMTREQLEDADVYSRANVDLGDVETLVLDASGALTHLVVELNGPGDMKVQVPIADLSPVDRNGDRDLVTDLTPGQLQALPAWTPPAR
ncbi:PRC-barrel domain-containing protein [uncultured Brevundimonas sp.]|uniref:PRC-barrel domain-containing protein n=1 Tax=uncultured Brevundimonas sp. TaxID=213418 RepID=UPI0025D03A5A|nr:PRC-barrel domain-containing protein [uncultured Brevundimonas sp.]